MGCKHFSGPVVIGERDRVEVKLRAPRQPLLEVPPIEWDGFGERLE